MLFHSKEEKAQHILIQMASFTITLTFHLALGHKVINNFLFMVIQIPIMKLIMASFLSHIVLEILSIVKKLKQLPIKIFMTFSIKMR